MNEAQKGHQRHEIFLSYASVDYPWVCHLVAHLKAAGLKVFIDRESIEPGTFWLDALQTAIKDARIGLLVLSRHTFESAWVQREWAAFLERAGTTNGFRIIPLVLDTDAPELPFLKQHQSIDFSDPAVYGAGVRKLLQTVGAMPPRNQEIAAPTVPRDGAVNQDPAGFDQFIDRILKSVSASPWNAILLARKDMPTAWSKDRMTQKARARFPDVRTVAIPYLPGATDSEFFVTIAKLLGLPSMVTGAPAFITNLHDQVSAAPPVFLLVTGIERLPDTIRVSFADSLRSLLEATDGRLRVLLIGENGLCSLKYGNGDLSVLSSARDLRWPDVTEADVVALGQEAGLDDRLFQFLTPNQLLALTGAHPNLLMDAFAALGEQTVRNADDLNPHLLNNQAVYRQFSLIRNDPQKVVKTRALLSQDDVGPFEWYLQDEVLNALYWGNLVKVQDGRLFWRCDIIKMIGRRVLEGN